MKTTATEDELLEAMRITRTTYPNVTFNRDPERLTRNWTAFTLTVNDSRGEFARLGMPHFRTGAQRHVKALCWHGHKEFFKALWGVNPRAVIRSTLGETTRESGFQDRPVNAHMNVWASQLCECAA